MSVAPWLNLRLSAVLLEQDVELAGNRAGLQQSSTVPGEDAGADPLKYFAQYPGRFPLVHVKDLKTLPHITAGGAQNYGDTVDLTEVGSGLIDWKKIFAQSDKAGIKHYIVEHDHPKQPFDSIKGSYDYLSKLRF